MQSHQDRPDHGLDDLLEQLTERTDSLTTEQANAITAGAEGEKPIGEWAHKSMTIRQMPDDPQGVLRISVGGNVGFGYCVFRGPRDACMTLLRQALNGLKLIQP